MENTNVIKKLAPSLFANYEGHQCHHITVDTNIITMFTKLIILRRTPMSSYYEGHQRHHIMKNTNVIKSRRTPMSSQRTLMSSNHKGH